MLNKSLVSVIVPAKNEENNIGRLLKSVQKQTYSRIEAVIVDDGSTDKTIEIAKEYTKLVYKRKHKERSVQRNFGAEQSKGKYLLFLDADMELTSQVIADCVAVALKSQAPAVTIPEKTVGKNFIARIRKFEREMYMNDPTIEVARFFERKVFFEFGGYDPNLTGPEDYDLPYRISKQHKLARAKEYILHHEENLTLIKLLRKKYYYAGRGALYAQKHPELIKTQGNTLFRKAYITHWTKFILNPFVGLSFIIVRILETAAAVAGFISAVGITNFVKTFFKMFLK